VPSQEDTQRANPAYLRLSIAYFAAICGSFILFLTRMDEKTPLSGIFVGGGLLLGAALAAAIITGRSIRFDLLAPMMVSEAEAHDTAGRAAWPTMVTVFLWLAALVSTIGAWVLNANNLFTLGGVLCWAISIGAWYFTLTRPYGGTPVEQYSEGRKARFSRTTLCILAAILLIGGWFRFRALDSYPPDMTSDQVENVLDVNRVLNGEYRVFFPNNEGRESLQMYYLALLQRLTGLPVGFPLL
jgi:hypothetical protein